MVFAPRIGNSSVAHSPLCRRRPPISWSVCVALERLALGDPLGAEGEVYFARAGAPLANVLGRAG